VTLVKLDVSRQSSFCGSEPHLDLREAPELDGRTSRQKYTVLSGSRYQRMLSSFPNRLTVRVTDAAQNCHPVHVILFLFHRSGRDFLTSSRSYSRSYLGRTFDTLRQNPDRTLEFEGGTVFIAFSIVTFLFSCFIYIRTALTTYLSWSISLLSASQVPSLVCQ
jgi:hypothetical protein